MSFEIMWWPNANATMDEVDARADLVTTSVHRLLARLEDDPFHPTLGSKVFATLDGQVRATPCRGAGGWTVMWTLGQADGTIEIVMVAELEVP